MGLFDGMKNPEEFHMRRRMLGQGMMALSQGQAPNLAGYQQMIAQRQQQRKQSEAVGQALESPGVAGMFTPEQTQALAQMPPAMAQKIIMAQMFQGNDPWAGIKEFGGQPYRMENGQMVPVSGYQADQNDRETQYVEGVGLIDKSTGEVIQTYDVGAKTDVKGESDLRKEFVGLKPVKAFTEQANAYGRIVASAKNPSPAGDLAMIFNFMKVLDPGSVVRESEFATAESAAKWMQESEEAGMTVPLPIASAIRKISTGQRLSPEQRQDFIDRAASIYGQAAQQHDQLAEQYGITAESYGYDRDRTIPDFRYRPEGAPPTATQRPKMRPDSAETAPQSQSPVPDSFIQSVGDPGSGLTAQDVWDSMTPEQKALFP